MRPPTDADNWIGLTSEPLLLDAAMAWVVLPGCGAQVVFSGTVRDHAGDRRGVIAIDYEAYPEQVEPRLRDIAEAARQRWPELGRLVLWHRTGTLDLGQSSVVVAASTPHRAEAFAAARYCIDTIKTTLPIWKRETWSGGVDWGTGATPVAEVNGGAGGPGRGGEAAGSRA